MTARADDKDIEQRLRAKRLEMLAEARSTEKEARRLRREGRHADAMTAFDRAGELYMDSNLAFDHEDDDLATEVRRSIERCRKIVDNLKYPKTKRSAAVTARPNCLFCGKPLRRYKIDGKTFNDGTPREWGDYGDGRFCGLRCGWRWACANTTVAQLKR